MFKFIAVFAVIAVTSAIYVPAAYQSVAYHPVAVVNHEPKVESWGHVAEKEAWAPKVVSWGQAQAEQSAWQPKVVVVKHESHGWEKKEEEKPANYDFKYEVHDEKTGDIKRQSETAVDGAIEGQYSLIDADGFRRVVKYTADDKNGFQAVVEREPLQHVQKVIQPVYVKKVVPHHVVAQVPHFW